MSLRNDERDQRSPGDGLPVTVVDGFGIWFPAIQSIFELTSWREDRGDISALVTLFRRDGDDEKRLVHRSRLLLYGPRARTEYVNLIKARTLRWPFTTDWLFTLEAVVGEAMRWYETGEPLVDLFEIEPPESQPYLFEPLIPDQEFCLIYGQGGSLKSYLGLALCLAVGTGAHLPGLGRPLLRGTSLYLDYETNAATHARRLRALAAGLGVEHIRNRVMYRQMARPLHQEAHQIRRLVVEREVRLIVIDSVGMACGGDINAAADALRTVSAINTLGAAAKLGIGHKNKADDFIGSVYWRNGPRAMWEVNGEQGRPGVQRTGYVHKKANDDRMRDPVALAWDFEPGRIRMEALDPRTVDVVSEKLPDVERVARYIEEMGYGTNAEIAGVLGISENSVRAYTSKLARAGRIAPASESRPGRGQPQMYQPSSNQDDAESLPW